ncbi:hypothetical protein PISMIDRAFT_683070 [Pisolithus microcarpus 441]|uniref:Uncharacterized protein n=1 Tax=Pisolithus microcarpus 441 TaxID=765257 RepID=A0A0C9YSE1_9AGAM|nr:hypothetical protein PISMIDRAFT_683070 [Pisolithus microcarpus 441]
MSPSVCCQDFIGVYNQKPVTVASPSSKANGKSTACVILGWTTLPHAVSGASWLPALTPSDAPLPVVSDCSTHIRNVVAGSTDAYVAIWANLTQRMERTFIVRALYFCLPTKDLKQI